MDLTRALTALCLFLVSVCLVFCFCAIFSLRHTLNEVALWRTDMQETVTDIITDLDSEQTQADEKEEIAVAEDPASVADAEDFLFIENTRLPDSGFDTLLIYRWNRRYPATRFFTLSTEGFRPAERTDFAGSSHDCITEERWVAE